MNTGTFKFALRRAPNQPDVNTDSWCDRSGHVIVMASEEVDFANCLSALTITAGDVPILRARTTRQLVDKVLAFARTKSGKVKMLDIVSHGAPGMLLLGDGLDPSGSTILDSSPLAVAPFRDLQEVLHEDCTIRLIACSVNGTHDRIGVEPIHAQTHYRSGTALIAALALATGRAIEAPSVQVSTATGWTGAGISAEGWAHANAHSFRVTESENRIDRSSPSPAGTDQPQTRGRTGLKRLSLATEVQTTIAAMWFNPLTERRGDLDLSPLGTFDQQLHWLLGVKLDAVRAEPTIVDARGILSIPLVWFEVELAGATREATLHHGWPATATDPGGWLLRVVLDDNRTIGIELPSQ